MHEVYSADGKTCGECGGQLDSQLRHVQQWYCGFCDTPTKVGQRLCARCKKVARRT